LLAFFAEDSILAMDGAPNYAGACEGAGISDAASGAPPVTGVSAFASDPDTAGLPAVLLLLLRSELGEWLAKVIFVTSSWVYYLHVCCIKNSAKKFS